MDQLLLFVRPCYLSIQHVFYSYNMLIRDMTEIITCMTVLEGWRMHIRISVLSQVIMLYNWYIQTPVDEMTRDSNL